MEQTEVEKQQFPICHPSKLMWHLKIAAFNITCGIFYKNIFNHFSSSEMRKVSVFLQLTPR
jgi:hypothetical protein